LEQKKTEVNLGRKAFSIAELTKVYRETQSGGPVNEESLLSILLKCDMDEIEASTYARDFFRKRSESDFEEFCEEWTRMNNFKVVQLISKEFRRIDKNNDNSLSKKELYAYFKLHMDDKIALEQIDQIFEIVDIDESGGVTPYELRMWYRNSISKGKIPKRKPKPKAAKASRPRKDRNRKAHATSRTEHKENVSPHLSLADRVHLVKQSEKLSKKKLKMEELKRSFKMMNKNNNQGPGSFYLTKFELQGLMYLAGLEAAISTKLVDDFMLLVEKQQGTTKNIKVHFEDFCREFLKIQMNSALNELRKTFLEERNKNKNARFTVKAITALLKEVHTLEFRNKEISEMLDKLDEDHDGEITWEEFSHWYSRLTSRYARTAASVPIRTNINKSLFHHTSWHPLGKVIAFGIEGTMVASVAPSDAAVLGHTCWELWGSIALNKPHGLEYPYLMDIDGPSTKKDLNRIQTFSLFDASARSKPKIPNFDFGYFQRNCILVPARCIHGISSTFPSETEPYKLGTAIVHWYEKKPNFNDLRPLLRLRKGGLRKCRTVTELAQGLGVEKMHALEKAQAAYMWVTENVRFMDGKSSAAVDVNEIITRKIGNSLGIATLLKQVMDKLGIACMVIEGKSRFNHAGEPIKHYWNGILLMHHGMLRWSLMDAAMAIEYMPKMQGRNFGQSIFFLQHPLHFAETHFPEKLHQRPDELNVVAVKVNVETFERKPEMLQFLDVPLRYAEFEESILEPAIEYYENKVHARITEDQFEEKGTGKIQVVVHKHLMVTCKIVKRDKPSRRMGKILSNCWTYERNPNEWYKEVECFNLRFALPYRGSYRIEVNVSDSETDIDSYKKLVFSMNVDVAEGTADNARSAAEHWLYGFIQANEKLRSKAAIEMARRMVIKRPKRGLIPFGKSFPIQITTPYEIESIVALTNGKWEVLGPCEEDKHHDQKVFEDRVVMSQTPELQLYMKLHGRYYKFAQFCPEEWDMKAKLSDKVSLDAYGFAFEAEFRVEEIRTLTTGAEIYISCGSGVELEVRAFHGWDQFTKAFNDFKITKMANSGSKQNYMIQFSFNMEKRYMANIYSSTKKIKEFKFTMRYLFGR